MDGPRGETGEKVHFGQAGADDFTTRKDEAKRKRWLARHKDDWSSTNF